MSRQKPGGLRPAVGRADHQSGALEAPVTLVEYGDFQCSWCYRAYPVVRQLQRRLGANLRFVFRNFPLTEIHPYARDAAQAAESVAASAGADAYWRMHHLLYEHQQDSPDALDHEHLLRYAAEAGAGADRVSLDL